MPTNDTSPDLIYAPHPFCQAMTPEDRTVLFLKMDRWRREERERRARPSSTLKPILSR